MTPTAARAVVAQPSDLCRALPELRERARDGAVGRVAKGHRQERARQPFSVGHLRLRQRVRQAPLRLNGDRVRPRRCRPCAASSGAARRRASPSARTRVISWHASGRALLDHSVHLSVNAPPVPSCSDRSRRPRPQSPDDASPGTLAAPRRLRGSRGWPRRSSPNLALPRTNPLGPKKPNASGSRRWNSMTCATARPRGGERKQQQKQISRCSRSWSSNARRGCRRPAPRRAGRRASARWPRKALAGARRRPERGDLGDPSWRVDNFRTAEDAADAHVRRRPRGCPWAPRCPRRSETVASILSCIHEPERP